MRRPGGCVELGHQVRDAVDRVGVDAATRSASSTLRPESSDTSRSDVVPPMSTATRPKSPGCSDRERPAHARPPFAVIASVSLRGSSCAAAPMPPAPIVSTTSPSRTMSASARGSSSSAAEHHGVEPAARADGAAQRLRVGAGDRLLRPPDRPRSTHERVRLGEHLGEVVEQVARARVAVRLEHQHEAPIRPGLARCLERRRDLRRVVP